MTIPSQIYWGACFILDHVSYNHVVVATNLFHFTFSLGVTFWKHVRLTNFTCTPPTDTYSQNIEPLMWSFLQLIPISNKRQVVLSEEDWKRYALFDPTKNYTRNLISTDDSTYTLIMLCWNPGKESPIHDHPCDGCWMQVCQGSVRECRYEKVNEKTVKDVMNDRLWCNSRHTYHEGQLAYIDDFMGYHKVGNPSETVPAVTLHLYCPPFDKCKIWLDPDHASKPSVSHVCYHSQFGCRRTIDWDDFVPSLRCNFFKTEYPL